jgi:acyl CoA:acetate/3-ketoacid CoA transferase beta subunit
VITELGVLEPDPQTRELRLTSVHRGVEVGEAIAATGWELKVAEHVEVIEPPSVDELAALRELSSR